METTSNNSVTDAQKKLDKAVKKAYGIKEEDDILEFLLNLNSECHKEVNKLQHRICLFFKDKTKLITDDCVQILAR